MNDSLSFGEPIIVKKIIGENLELKKYLLRGMFYVGNNYTFKQSSSAPIQTSHFD